MVVLLFLAPGFYELWWYWQLFAFTRREEFPRTRSFWWLFCPIYNWVVIYRQFDDLRRAAMRAMIPAVSASLAILLVILSMLAGAHADRTTHAGAVLEALIVSGALLAIVGPMVQRTANAYLEDKYPGARFSRMTWGERTAAVLGILVLALLAVSAVISPS